MSVEVKRTALVLHEAPVHIKGNSVKSKCLDLLKDIEPETSNRKPVMSENGGDMKSTKKGRTAMDEIRQTKS
jgi:hypothetical protein